MKTMNRNLQPLNPRRLVEDKTMPLYVSAHSFITSTYVSFHVPDDTPGQFTAVFVATAAGTLWDFLLFTSTNYSLSDISVT